MTTDLRVRNQSQQLYIRALSQVWRNGIQIHDPSTWLVRDAETEEKMLRDADIAHAVGYRRHLIAGRGWTVQPRVETSPRAPIAVSVATELLKGVKHFTDARLNLARAFFSGSRFARIHGTPRTMTIGDGKSRRTGRPWRRIGNGGTSPPSNSSPRPRPTRSRPSATSTKTTRRH